MTDCELRCVQIVIASVPRSIGVRRVKLFKNPPVNRERKWHLRTDKGDFSFYLLILYIVIKVRLFTIKCSCQIIAFACA